MKTKIFFTVIYLLLFFSYSVSRDCRGNVIIISEENLISLIKKIKEKRDIVFI
jgi:hypothetical protein